MTDYHLNVNGKSQVVTEVDNSTPLLWILRDTLGLVGTKYGCGIAVCGACTIHLDGIPIRSCSFPVSAVDGKKILTIEGLANKDGSLHALQQAWIASDVVIVRPGKSYLLLLYSMKIPIPVIPILMRL